jgi:hypothetical protein
MISLLKTLHLQFHDAVKLLSVIYLEMMVIKRGPASYSIATNMVTYSETVLLMLAMVLQANEESCWEIH